MVGYGNFNTLINTTHRTELSLFRSVVMLTLM